MLWLFRYLAFRISIGAGLIKILTLTLTLTLSLTLTLPVFIGSAEDVAELVSYGDVQQGATAYLD